MSEGANWTTGRRVGVETAADSLMTGTPDLRDPVTSLSGVSSRPQYLPTLAFNCTSLCRYGSGGSLQKCVWTEPARDASRLPDPGHANCAMLQCGTLLRPHFGASDRPSEIDARTNGNT
jgi:hypothetical protein